jgi:hypothetical protein
LHLPQVGRAFEAPRSCPASIYPVDAQYRFERCGSARAPLGWARCSQVTYTVSAGLAPPSYQADLQNAISALRMATGLRLIQVAGPADISIGWDSTFTIPCRVRAERRA